MGAASEISEKRFGGILKVRERTVAIGTTQVEVLPNDPDRVQALITMLTAGIVTLSFESPVTAGVGLLLGGQGSTYRAIVRDDGDTIGWRLHAIANLASQTVRVIEIVREIVLAPQQEVA